jgi:CSLREA domain-containing protein
MVDEVVGRRRYWVLVAALVVLPCALAMPAVASAENFTVNSTADETDVTPGDEACLTAGLKCTLRAAIEEANSLEEFDEIVFDEEVFDGGGTVPSTISLGSSLPTITERGAINGRECPTAAGVGGPCVRIDGPDAEHAALIVDHTEEFEISGLAVTGAQTGVSVDSSSHFSAQASWFGVKLDGSPGGNTTGIFIGPESDKALIGGEGPERGNVFANNTDDGLDIHGAGKVRVLGNYFGTEKDGATPAPNGKDIEVTSTSGGEFQATGNSIGTRVSFGSSATSPECDGGCNLISGAVSNGIDLEGDGGSEAPAVATTIAGNYIGLNATGTAPVANAAADIRVGSAAQTVIGGPKLGETNRINGGSVGVIAGPAAADLVVRGNLLGVDSTGTEILAPPGEGIAVNSEEVPNAAVEAAIVDNEIGMNGGVAIAQQGLGARISGNEIFGAETGIKAYGPTEEIRGNLIEGNLIEAAEANGILVENGFNEILGNEIVQAGGAGVSIRGLLPFGIAENLVGGDAAADENVIDGSGGDAIEIFDTEETENEVARNRGTANNGLFIDLVAAGAEPKGPNKGIEPPQFSTLTQAGASGSGAEAGARVRVFRKQIAAAGELDSFLGEATADEGGNWEVVYDSAIPGGSRVAATQTSEAGGTSELATATTPGEAGSVEGGGEGGGAASGSSAGTAGGVSSSTGDTSRSAGRIRPRTKIVRTPKRRSRSSSVRFEFKSDEPGSVFLCKLDRKPFDLCKSPKKYEDLKPGTHVFEVRAIDPAGHVDSSPAKKTFTVIG